MTPQQLKNAILQQAIQGKLVEQRVEEGTGQELFEAIQDEKEKLIEEGKLKKQKALPQITEDEIPFEIPDTWKWVRLGEIGFTNIGLTYKPTDISNDGTIVLRSSNIQNGKLDFSDIVRVKKDIPEAKMCQVGDILICARNGSKKLVGKAALIHLEGMSFGAFMAVYRSICNGYVLHFINSAYFRNALLPETGTTTINQLTQDSLKNCVIPLPPLAEQERIVEKIEELLPLVERYEKAWTRLEELNKKFPLDMQKAILGQAIQGKLVEQRAEEGTGQELFEAIQEEKQKLIEEGKLKKQKALPQITEDEIPFEIPETWKWVRLGEIISIESGNGLTTANMIKGNIPVYGGNGITGYHNESTIHEKTIVIGRVGYYCGSVHITEPEAWVTDNAFVTKYPKNFIDMLFLVHILRYMNLGNRNNATAQPVISGKKIYPLLFPLPPLAEQKRIVEKIEELLPLVEKLK